MNSDEQKLEKQMKVTFKVDEMNGFYQTFAPLDLDELWRLLDEEVDQPRAVAAST